VGLSVGGDFTGSAGIRSWTALTLPGVKLGAELAKWCGGVVAMFTPAALVLTVLAAIPALRRRARVEGSEFERVLAVLLATGFAHVVLFPAGAFIHDYWTFLLVPGVALACGAVIESMRAAAERRFGEGFGVLVVLASLAAIGVSAVASREAWYGREGDPRHAIPCADRHASAWLDRVDRARADEHPVVRVSPVVRVRGCESIPRFEGLIHSRTHKVPTAAAAAVSTGRSRQPTPFISEFGDCRRRATPGEAENMNQSD
jgi:hypothetical protein